MRLASLLLALTAAPAARAAPTGRTKHLHKLEADLDELEKMHEYVLERSFDKTNPDVCSREVDSCDDALPDILKRAKNDEIWKSYDEILADLEINDDECAKYKTKDDSGEYIVCRKAYFSIGCASQRGWKLKRFCKDLVGAQVGAQARKEKREQQKQRVFLKHASQYKNKEENERIKKLTPHLREYILR